MAGIRKTIGNKRVLECSALLIPKYIGEMTFHCTKERVMVGCGSGRVQVLARFRLGGTWVNDLTQHPHSQALWTRPDAVNSFPQTLESGSKLGICYKTKSKRRLWYVNIIFLAPG
ncbi:hypothetical protein J6590_000668 [Homalodisca vitripennis]|nr:hypothetical protein J6590_000668 [Homalodisca vitripennis]